MSALGATVDPALQALSTVPFPSLTVNGAAAARANAAGSASQSSSTQTASVPRSDKSKTSRKRKAEALEEPETICKIFIPDTQSSSGSCFRREDEDYRGRKSMWFLTSPSSDGNAAWQRAFDEDKRLSALFAKRNGADSIMIQALFHAKVKNAWNLAADPDGPPPLITLDTFGITQGVHVALAQYTDDNLGFQVDPALMAEY
ncbi:uncharacterized protein LY89DRAFT_787940 [Mollisia scopiformis]|uniref:Uncharacterized protein n=1 Tax=Mollisia scopiformis TaxID=149040 RepID=A0A132BDC1_MOLSC|nr:uncharacterized protein LY89DRAFT_787940 [Mollisia scopiformis]KUJ09657.1 hypothetical protein LY89DRAFT_787940 [Mollisia scopiformis]